MTSILWSANITRLYFLEVYIDRSVETWQSVLATPQDDHFLSAIFTSIYLAVSELIVEGEYPRLGMQIQSF